MTKLKIFLASPGDVSEERNIVSVVVEELRRTIGEIAHIDLETVRWETHAWPDVGEDAQDVINKEIGDFDVFIGIMWRRFGTPTKRALSGTGEEFKRAFGYFKKYNRPKIMFYFRTSPFYTTDKAEWRQFQRVLDFRKGLERQGVLFWEYGEPIEFERRVREHLIKQILQLTSRPDQQVASKSPLIFLSYKRGDISRVERVYEALKASGFSPWMDVRDILPGDQWVDAIQEAILRADFFLPFVSKESVRAGLSQNASTYTRTEVALAIEREDEEPQPGGNCRIIPARLDPVEPPPTLSKYQWVDLFVPGGVQDLIRGIQRIWDQRAARP